MAELPIVYITDPVLMQVAKPVAKVDDSVRKLMNQMLETMYEYEGIGLAANQVGVLDRVIVVDVHDSEEGETPVIYKMANPEITWESDEKNTYEEGCLSIPLGKGEVTRPEKITVKYLDENNEEQELTTGGLLSTAIQHEVDHLNGVLFIDYLSKLKRDMIKKKVVKYVRSL